MTSGQKVALSLLISVLAFCAFTVVAFSGLFDLLEVNFYQPVVQEIKEKKLNEIASAQTEYFDTLMKRFDSFTVNPDVKSYVESRPADSAVRARETARSQLVTATASLSGLRIIDNNGRNVYFSTFSSDVISTANGISYRNYDSSGEIAFDSLRAKQSVTITADSDKKTRIIKDGAHNRIIFSLPFFNSGNEYKATALFYCDAAGFSQFLFNRNLIDINGFASLVTENQKNDGTLSGFGGFVFGLPNYGHSSLQTQLLEKWRETHASSFFRLASVANEGENPEANAETALCAFSLPSSHEDFGFITLLYSERELKFPHYIRILLLATAFFTFYLAIFLILSFKHDDIVVIRDKVRRYENEFFIAYKKLDDKTSEYLAEQKPVLERRILKSLGKKGEKHAAEFKSIFESYWQELSASFVTGQVALASGQNAVPAINAEELKEIVRSSLEDILENGKIQINATAISAPPRSEPAPAHEETKRVEEVEVAETLEEAEPAEAIEEVDEIEDAEAAEELDDVEDVEEAESPEEVEELDEVEEAELAEEVEELDEVEDAETVEELDETESVEEIAEVEDAESLEEVEELGEVEEAESAEVVEEVEELDEVEDTETVEEVEELDEIEEVESAEELEDSDKEPLAQLQLGSGVEPSENEDSDNNFSTFDKIDSIQELDEIEDLPSVSEEEAHAEYITKTLSALPEKAPQWENNDEIELDSDGLSRKLSRSEQHDMEKLKEVTKYIDELDTNLEELEMSDPVDMLEKKESVDANAFVPHLMDSNVSPDDDIYKDEMLLEKIEFGVPTSEINESDIDDSVSENFVASAPDYSYLDDDDVDDRMYAPVSESNVTEDEHFFENPAPAKSEKEMESENEVESETEVENEAEEVEMLEEPVETMPFTLTKFASADANSEIIELEEEESQ